MTLDEQFRHWFATIEVNDSFSEATIALTDGSRLVFRHRVGERWAKAAGPEGTDHHAGKGLAGIARFRLNAKHLDIQFTDGSRWELAFHQRPMGTEPSR